MRDLFVFRSDKQEVLDALHAAKDAYLEWSDRIEAFAAEVHPDSKPMVRRQNRGGGDRFDAVSVREPVPEGWRVKTQREGADLMVPRLSTKAGKAWNERLNEIREAPDIRSSLPGMPSGGLDGLAYVAPGIEEHDGAVWVIWSCDPDAMDSGWSRTSKKVDGFIWERVKLSEYYAMKEALEVSV